jgi:hypothetical protein
LSKAFLLREFGFALKLNEHENVITMEMCATNIDAFDLHISKAILSQVFLKSLLVICLTIILFRN